MRRKFRHIDGKLVEFHAAADRPRGPLIAGDIEPYTSIITGEQITSRSKHREHLRQHGCEEVGDQIPKFLKDKYEREHIRPAWGRDGRRAD